MLVRDPHQARQDLLRGVASGGDVSRVDDPEVTFSLSGDAFAHGFLDSGERFGRDLAVVSSFQRGECLRELRPRLLRHGEELLRFPLAKNLLVHPRPPLRLEVVPNRGVALVVVVAKLVEVVLLVGEHRTLVFLLGDSLLLAPRLSHLNLSLLLLDEVLTDPLHGELLLVLSRHEELLCREYLLACVIGEDVALGNLLLRANLLRSEPFLQLQFLLCGSGCLLRLVGGKRHRRGAQADVDGRLLGWTRAEPRVRLGRRPTSRRGRCRD